MHIKKVNIHIHFQKLKKKKIKTSCKKCIKVMKNGKAVSVLIQIIPNDLPKLSISQ